jgi:3-oxoacyl-[acyl-carrier-protein] synthase II
MHDVVITGYGLLASNGERGDIAGYPIFKHEPVEFETQIAKKSDLRQMDAWQRIGVYAAGLALDMAGVKGNAEQLSKMHMIIAAGGGERDTAVDALILNGIKQIDNAGAYLNTSLMSELRPTLFLSQLSNLLAGNISIVHGVIGSSRTFMGEELAGIDAVRIATDRIKAGQGEIFLVGGSYNADRPDVIMLYTSNGQLKKGDHAGMTLGSVGAFLVVESREHAVKRGAKPLAQIQSVYSDRLAGDVNHALNSLYTKANVARDTPVISSSSQAPKFAKAEKNFFKHALYDAADRIGHSMEAAFPAAICLGVQELHMHKSLVIAGLGHQVGEGLAHLTAEI